MKYCIKCLRENEDKAEKCAACGYPFGQRLDVLNVKWEKVRNKTEKKN